APSCTLLSSPMTIASESPRSTAVGHTDTRAPSVTSPSTTAFACTNAVRSIFPILVSGPCQRRSLAHGRARGGEASRPSLDRKRQRLTLLFAGTGARYPPPLFR